TFQVEYSEGRWRIPSHHGYPADAEARIEKAAAGLIGITREALAGRRENDHKRFGVIAPPDTEVPLGEILEGIGQRVTMKDKNGDILADYIIGKRIAGQTNKYFVRKPDDDETYRAEVHLDVSTKFSDWVEKDLLKLDYNNVLSMESSEILLFNEKVTEDGKRVFLPHKRSLRVFRKETEPSAKWNVDDLNAQTEEVNPSGISDVQTALAGLRLNGVRPKPQGLTPELKADEKLFPNDRASDEYISQVLGPQLRRQGFQLVPQSPLPPFKDFMIAGKGGELTVDSNEGLVYYLHFGEVFAGTTEDIEVGKTVVADEAGNKVSEAETNTKDASEKDKTTLNRYLFIRVEFDEDLLGKAPVEPQEPKKPEGLKELVEPPPTGETKKDKTPEEIEQDRLRSEYNSKLSLYQNEKSHYDADIVEYREKLKNGKAKAEELNTRFSDWYYVIPETSYDNLVLNRADVVKAKEQKEPEPEAKPMSPTLNSPVTPSFEDFIKNQMKSSKAPAKEERKPAIAEKPKPSAANAPNKPE
ncbi:MAG: DUF4340 domain-containing protein, partial [Planctomycetaceae bacterium]|nr:DUF4340 domain-containing protein [Planctomycetaceae bacterium]